jgi:hypothetical protein
MSTRDGARMSTGKSSDHSKNDWKRFTSFKKR